MTHDHNLIDSDSRFIIDPVSRGITTDSKKLKLMRGDHNFERYTFEIPRYIDGHDMSLCNDIRINYENISGTNRTDISTGPYKVIDAEVSDDKVIFSWLLSGNTTKYAGSLQFSVSFKCITNSIVDYSWSTDTFKNIVISDIVSNSGDAVVETYTDILVQWEERLFTEGGNNNRIIGTKNNNTIEFSKTAAEIYELGYDLLNYDAVLIEDRKLYRAVAIKGSYEEYISVEFKNITEGFYTSYYIRFNKNGTISHTIAHNNTNISDIPSPINDSKRRYLISLNGSYKLVDTVVDTDSTVLYAGDTENGLELAVPVTIEYLMNNMNIGTISHSKLSVNVIRNDTLVGFSTYHFAKFGATDTGDMYVNFTNDTGTNIRMNSDGSLSYINSNYLTDTVTGKKYKLEVADGKLTMTEVTA